MKRSRLMTGTVAAVLAVGTLAACGSGDGDGGSDAPEASGEFPAEWEDEITIDVFSGLSNYMGMQEGWFGQMVKDKFNMKLNIIAPNVAGGGDTLYNTRVSAGDLGDLIITDKGKKLDELVQGGLLLDASPYLPAMTNAAEYTPAIEYINDGKDGVFGFPTQVSSLLPTQSIEVLEPTFGAYLRWDIYGAIGYPEIGTLEDLLPVLKEMQEAEPTAPNGKQTYALSLFKDWDGNMMNNAKQPITYYGFDEVGFALARADGSEYQGLLDDEGMYKRVLKFFFEANQMGLVDPESTTQNYDTLFAKFQNGQVLYGFWPWLTQSAYNTEENTTEGRGFMLAEIADQEIFSFGAESLGATQVAAIGAKAEDPERIAAFIDWFYSPEGAESNSGQTQGGPGPLGLTWEIGEDGAPVPTEFGKGVYLTGDGTVPEEWGGGSYTDGGSALNTNFVLSASEDPRTGAPFNYQTWPSYQELTQTPLIADWSEQMGGATTGMDFLTTNEQVVVAPGASFTRPTDSSEIETLRNQVKAVIVQYSWQSVFAANEGEFDTLWATLVDTAKGLGYEQVLEVDMATAVAQNEAREAVAAATE